MIDLIKEDFSVGSDATSLRAEGAVVQSLILRIVTACRDIWAGFSTIFRKKESSILWKVSGSQEWSWGFCNQEKALAIFQHLRTVTPHPSVVDFDLNSVERSYLIGGTCSAMSLHCAYEVLRSHCIENQSLSDLQAILQQHEFSGVKFRNIQSAFNSIFVLPEARKKFSGEELVHEKMRALGSLFGMQLGDRCDLVELGENAPTGVYIGRAIYPIENHKMEKFGHTIAVFRLHDQTVLYDPNEGGMGISLGKSKDTLTESCSKIQKTWDLSDFSFFPVKCVDYDQVIPPSILAV